MALISCHALNSVFGTNASAIGVRLVRLDGENTQLFAVNASDDGRIKESISGITDGNYELIFATKQYLVEGDLVGADASILPEVSIRFSMPNPDAHYHFSMAFTPGSFSVVAVVQK